MKKFVPCLCLFLCTAILSGTMVSAQSSKKNVSSFVVKNKKKNDGAISDMNRAESPITIEVAFDKAVHLSFGKQLISYCDVGTPDIIYKKVNDNKDLKMVCRTERPGFRESNLTVIAGGYYYTFKIRYNNNPSKTIYFITPEDAYSRPPGAASTAAETEIENEKTPEETAKIAENEKKLKSDAAVIKTCEDILASDMAPVNESNINGRMGLRLNNIYISDNKLFFHIKLENHSNIAYDVDIIRFSVENRKKSKIKVVQDRDISPLYIHNYETHIPGMENTQSMVYVFDKFTIDNKNKILLIESWEKEGDRNLRIKLAGKAILDATVL